MSIYHIQCALFLVSPPSPPMKLKRQTVQCERLLNSHHFGQLLQLANEKQSFMLMRKSHFLLLALYQGQMFFYKSSSKKQSTGHFPAAVGACSNHDGSLAHRHVLDQIMICQKFGPKRTNHKSHSYTWCTQCYFINSLPFIDNNYNFLQSFNKESKNRSLFQLKPTYHVKLSNVHPLQV